jgi:hypothetical protein
LQGARIVIEPRFQVKPSCGAEVGGARQTEEKRKCHALTRERRTTYASALPGTGGITISISDGGTFPNLRLSNYVSDPDDDPRYLTWRVSGTVELNAVILGQDLAVILPHTQWIGSETLQLQACDPAGLCDTGTVVYTVRAENDPPIVRVDVDKIREDFPNLVLLDQEMEQWLMPR